MSLTTQKDIADITFDDVIQWFSSRTTEKIFGTVIKEENIPQLKEIFQLVQTTFKKDPTATEIVYGTYSSFHRLLCHNLGKCLGYETRKEKKKCYKEVSCHEYDGPDYDTGVTYCACDKMPQKVTKYGISYTRNDDSDHDEDYDEHIYSLPRIGVVGVRFTRSLY